LAIGSADIERIECSGLWYRRSMTRAGSLIAVIAVIAVAACGPTTSSTGDSTTSAIDRDPVGTSAIAGATYSRAEVVRAINAERDKLVALDRDRETVPDDLRLVAMNADRAVLAGAVALLERCLDKTGTCPPALTTTPDPDFDPDARPPSLDVAGWRIVAARLHAAACGCRTMACVDGYTETLRVQEAANDDATDGDEVASASVTAARECLWVLRGKR
jgi:hypothetical protein